MPLDAQREREAFRLFSEDVGRWVQKGLLRPFIRRYGVTETRLPRGPGTTAAASEPSMHSVLHSTGVCLEPIRFQWCEE